MVLDKMAAICLDFKKLCFRILDPIQNLDHLQPNLFLTIKNPDLSGFQIPIVLNKSGIQIPTLPEKLKCQEFRSFWFASFALL